MRIQRSESIAKTRASAWRASELDDRARKERVKNEKKRERKGEKGRDERREREGRFQYAGAYLSIHFRGQRLRDEEPLHPRRLSRPSRFHGTVSQQADAVHHDPSIHPSIDRSHECAHTSRLGGGVRFRFFFRPRWERFIIVEPGEIYCLSWEIDSCFVVYRAIVSSIMGWIERVEKVWESCSGFRILDWRRYLEIFFVLENLILKSNEPIPNIH